MSLHPPSSSYYTPHHIPLSSFHTNQYIKMTPYSHQSNISTPPTPREGNKFPPLKSHQKQNQINKGEYEEERGPFDEDDIELQLSSHSLSNLELGLKVLKYCSILFLGLVIIGGSFHISNVLYRK